MKKGFTTIFSVLLIAAAMMCCPDAGATTYYVKPNAESTAWSSVADQSKVYTSVNTAYTAATVAADEIWIATGTYTVTTALVPKTVGLYGGFDGTETGISQRAKVPGGKPWEFVNVTTFNNGAASVIANNTTANIGITIDGITFDGQGTAGRKAVEFSSSQTTTTHVISNCIVKNYNITATSGNGGGLNIVNKTTIVGCLITNNKHGNNAAGVWFGVGGCEIRDCEISNNTAGNNGGGIATMVTSGSAVNVYNCVIKDNKATYGGGGIYAIGMQGGSIFGCLIEGNTAAKGGGISFDRRYTSKVYNSTIVNNTSTATDGVGGVAFYDNAAGSGTGHSNLINSIVWNNTDKDGAVVNCGRIADLTTTNMVQSCLVDKTDYANVTFNAACVTATDGDAIFTNTAVKDFTLKSSSPAVDAGLISLPTGTPNVDLAGNTRQRRTIDMGAYELQDIRVLAVAGSGVSITTPKQFVTSGSNANVTFTLEANFSAPIKVNDVVVSLTPAAGVYTYALNNVTVDTDITIAATATVAYDVTVTATNVTLIAPALTDSKFQYPAQSEITFTVNTGYENPAVTVGGQSYSLGAAVGGVYTVTLTDALVSGATEVVITATAKQFDFTLDYTEGISGTPSTNVTAGKVTYGDNVTVSFEIASGKNYPYATVNGVYYALAENNGTYSLTFTATAATTVKLTGYFFDENVLPVAEDTYYRYQNTNISGTYANEPSMMSRGSGGYAATPLLKFVPTQAQKDAGYNKAMLKLVFSALGNVSSGTGFTYTAGQVPSTYATINDVPATVNVNAGSLGAWTQVGTASESISSVVNTSISVDVTDSYVLNMPAEIRLGVFKGAGNNYLYFHSLENGNPAYIPVLVFEKTGTVSLPQVAADDSDVPVRYYNLQGIEIFTPAKGNIYIVKQGAKVTKVIY